RGEAARDGEPEPGALAVLAGGGPVEGGEEVRLICERDARPLIDDGELDAVGVDGELDADLPVGRAEGDGVVDQVAQGPSEVRDGAADLERELAELGGAGGDDDPVTVDLGARHSQGLAHDVADRRAGAR